MIEANYLGEAAEHFVIRQLLINGWDVFVKTNDCEIDLVTRNPDCKHLISLQVKLAYDGKSFHVGEYKHVDFYAVVYEDIYNDYEVGYQIAWVPTFEVTAGSHAGLTDDMKGMYTMRVPICSQPD